MLWYHHCCCQGDDYVDYSDKNEIPHVFLVFRQHPPTPNSLLFAFGDALGDADGAGGADEAAQVTAHALGAHKVGLAVFAEGDGLVAAIHAGDVASAAADALVGVEDGKDDGVTVQVVGRNKAGKPLTYKGREFGDASARHIVLQTQLEVIDDAIAVLHHGGAYLQVAAAQLDELKRVSPGFDAANTAQF